MIHAPEADRSDIEGRRIAMSITIREKDSGTALAEAEEGPSLAKYEGNWYFDPAAVRPTS